MLACRTSFFYKEERCTTHIITLCSLLHACIPLQRPRAAALLLRRLLRAAATAAALCWATSHPPLLRDGFGPPVGPWQTGPWMLSLAPVPSASNTLLLLRPVPPVLPMMRRRRHLTPAKSMPWPSKTYVCFSNLFCVVFSRTYIHSI